MCGIAGGINSPLDTTLMQFLLKKIAHRGPDDHGVYTDDNLVLGNARLAIQDLSPQGHQPMQSEDGNYTIVFNGEIYNHPQLKNELSAKGYHYRSNCDTESLLFAFMEWGEGCLQKIEGIFAFAIYDRRQKRVFIARDSFGVKPLYYYHDGKSLLFCSELKGLMRIEGLDYSLRPEIFFNYLMLLWSYGSPTPFRHIHKLEPGHCMSIDLNHPEHCKPLPFERRQAEAIQENDPVVHTESLLRQSLRRQMISDAPVGLLLSGGLDSSLLAALHQSEFPGSEIQTFTIDTGETLKEEGFKDDLAFAKLVAQQLKLDLQVIPAAIDIASGFDQMIWHLDEPQSDPAALFVQKISTEAKRRGIKVLLSGMGADELFSGYRRHQAMYYSGLVRKAPGLVVRGLAGMGAAINQPASRRMQKLLQLNGAKTTAEQFAFLYYWQKTAVVKNLFHADLRAGIDEKAFEKYLSEVLPQSGSDAPLEQLLYCDQRCYLPNHNLNYSDKMSMAAGVELRVPYLDGDLAAYARQLPPDLKMKRTNTKQVLRAIAKNYLPETIINRSKTGFGAPVRSWIKNEMKTMVEERLLDEQFTRYGIFDKTAVHRLIDSNTSGKADAAWTIFALLAAESWLRQFSR